MKYAKIVNNIVVQIQPNKQDGFIEVGNDVICGMVLEYGKFIVKDLRTDKEIEEQRIEDIKNKAKELILNKYSIEKQSSANIGIYGNEYLEEMKLYISNIINISNEAELNGTLADDVIWL